MAEEGARRFAHVFVPLGEPCSWIVRQRKLKGHGWGVGTSHDGWMDGWMDGRMDELRLKTTTNITNVVVNVMRDYDKGERRGCIANHLIIRVIYQ